MKSFLFALSLLISLSSHAFIIEMSEEDVEEKISKGLPYELKTEILKVSIQQPNVIFPENSDRLQVEVNVVLETLSDSYKGTATLESGIAYKAEQGAFYLQDPQITDLKIPGLSFGFQLTGKQLLNQIAKDYFSRIKVYQLDNNKPGESMASSMLNGVTIKNQKLLLDVDLF